MGGFRLSRDKHFVEKLTDAVGLYLNPPDKAVVLCVDNTSHPRLSGEETTVNPKPFIWTASVEKILKKVQHCKGILETVH